jgi:hypothetical protein
MKIKLTEYNGCFGFELEAETVSDAAQLTRFGMNSTKEIRYAETFVTGDGSFSTNITLGKRKKSLSTIQKVK